MQCTEGPHIRAKGLRVVTPAVCPNKAVAVSYAQLVVCFDYFCVLALQMQAGRGTKSGMRQGGEGSV